MTAAASARKEAVGAAFVARSAAPSAFAVPAIRAPPVWLPKDSPPPASRQAGGPPPQRFLSWTARIDLLRTEW
jgi:hypothetical protein